MKKLLVCLLFISITISISSKTRTQNEAFQIASAFITKSSAQKAPSATNATQLHLVQKVTNTADNIQPHYYIFNHGTNNGYIIVSGDDRAKSILGFTQSGSFNYDSIPENLKYWLSFYDAEISSLATTSNQGPQLKAYKSSILEQANASTVSPLLTNIQWNQGSPYNLFCPIIDSTKNTRAVTGCVATGMAQVMRYHQWPVQGTGSNAYTSNTYKIPLSIDFSQTTFDWANMTHSYNATSTTIQNEAVANLMYNCGVAVNMDYAETSGASGRKMGLALKTYFGYDSNLQYYSRDYYKRAEWIELITTELNASRPVLYGGNSNDGGHLFVCDGYDSNGLFHFNWGWGGSSNGYFQISALDPSVQGIGGSSGGFNMNQGIVTGVQKPSTSSIASYLLHTNDTIAYPASDIIRTAPFSITAKKLYNFGLNSFSGSIAVALYNESGFVQLLKNYTGIQRNSGSGWSTYNMSSITIPTSIANGNYQLYVVYKTETASNWEIIRGLVGNPNYVALEIKSDSIKFSSPTLVKPALQLNSMTVNGNLYQNKTGRFNLNISNLGGEYNSKIHIYLESTTTDTVYQIVSSESVNFASGENRSLDFNNIIDLLPGKYYLVALKDPSNNLSNENNLDQLGEYQIVDILAEPTANANLVLSSAISFPNPLQVEKNLATLSATISNTSGYYDNKLIAFVFAKAGGASLAYLGYQNAILDINESKTFSFSGRLDLPLGEYMIAVYARNTENAWIKINPTENSVLNFTLVDNALGLNSLDLNNNLNIYPNPVANQLNLSTDTEMQEIEIRNLLGKQVTMSRVNVVNKLSIPVEYLKPGIYIIKVKTSTGNYTSKFIKK